MTAVSPEQTDSPWFEFAIAALHRAVGELVLCGRSGRLPCCCERPLSVTVADIN